MSLDVYLTMPIAQMVESKIYIRANGANVEISRADWDALYPGCEPFETGPTETNEVFTANITHNLCAMADAAGIENVLWEPNEYGITKARQLIVPLRNGLEYLKSSPDFFRGYNPKNGWGTYEGFVDFVEKYLAACEAYPDADVSVSR